VLIKKQKKKIAPTQKRFSKVIEGGTQHQIKGFGVKKKNETARKKKMETLQSSEEGGD